MGNTLDKSHKHRMKSSGGAKVEEMTKTSNVINKEAWRDIYRLELNIKRLEKIVRETDVPHTEEDAEDFPIARPKTNLRDLKSSELREHKRILWQLKKENPTEPLGKELLEILESMKN
jgi:hypothetical protein